MAGEAGELEARGQEGKKKKYGTDGGEEAQMTMALSI